ncbi:MAG: NAD(P)/FAD-dependent oxidoreductase [Candidatus Aminicenantes bacterium]|nr:NAD(P)/FAD-dependent oxidoreductase [Candidatus Aminicenantes bacterium]
MAKSIIIIGAGMGGMAAGIYGQMNGYETQIFEMHTKPGGQCTSWKRKGYTFDPCIHHFFGCKPGSSVNQMWHELGALPLELVNIEECTAVASPDGKMFVDYYDLERLKNTLLKLSPADSKMIEQYIEAIKAFANNKIDDAISSGSFWKMIPIFFSMPSIRKWIKMNMRAFAERFSDPFLRKAFAQLVYSNPDGPLFFHFMRHVGGMNGDIRWPVGGAAEFAKSIERRYLALGGKVYYRSRVEKILVENDKAVGIRLADGSEHRADIIISNADGRKTIFNMLDGKYINETVRGYCAPLSDETPFAVNVCLGINRDLSGEPSSLVLLLDQPVTIANLKHENIEAQLYGFDKTMAPMGKGTIKVELPARYSYWKQLYNDDRERYKQEKQKAAEQVIEILESHFRGIKNQVEVIDVYTLMTWERYMGGTQGWFNLPNRKLDFSMSMKEDLSDKKFKTTLPGLSNFYFVGIWATAMGSLAHNANSGKTIIRRICKKDGKGFEAQT